MLARLARLAAAVALLFAFAGSAHAGLRVLEPAPEFQLEEAVGGDVPKLADAAGKALAVVFFSTDVPNMERYLRELDELREQNEGKLHCVAITKEFKEAVEKFLNKKKLSLGYTIGLDLDTDTWAGWGINGYPFWYVIDPYGEVTWGGGSREQDEFRAAVRDATAEVVTLSLTKEQTSKAFKKMWSSYARGDFKSVLKLLTKLAKKKKGDDKAHAETLLAEIKAVGMRRLKRAHVLEERREILAAERIYNALSKQFKGTEAGDAATAKLKSWKKDKRMKAELKAQRLLAEAEILEDKRGMLPKAIQLYQAIAKSFPQTWAAADAEKALKRLAK